MDFPSHPLGFTYEDETSQQTSTSYPDISPITFSQSKVFGRGGSLNGLGVLFGCIVQPFITNKVKRIASSDNSVSQNDLARCGNCAGYINKLCDVNSTRWYCILCNRRNFYPKSQYRYRDLDLAKLPELLDIMADIRIPFENGLESYSVEERPLIHLFIIQESMAIESLLIVIDGLSTAVKGLHPDIQIMLMVYSNRIGLYRLSGVSEGCHSCMQIIHFSESWKSTIEEKKIIEGNTFNMNDPSKTKFMKTGHGKISQTLIPLSEVVDFVDAATPCGSHRLAFLEALASIPDSISRLDEMHDPTPNNFLGPFLETLFEWMVEPSINLESERITSSSDDPISSKSSNADFPNLFNSWTNALFNTFQANSVDGSNLKTTSKDGKLSSDGVSGSQKKTSTSTISPIDACHGVIVHLFMDSAQDLPVDYHDSVDTETISSSSKPFQSRSIKKSWIMDLATKFSKKSVSFNLWMIADFDGHELGTYSLEPLVRMTGGIMDKTVLGLQPEHEKQRLTEKLRRSFSKTYATRGIMKVRSSNKIFSIDKATISGPIQIDEDFANVYRLSSINRDTCIGFEFIPCEIAEDDTSGHVTLQIAFSYETIDSDYKNNCQNDVSEISHQSISEDNSNPDETGFEYVNYVIEMLGCKELEKFREEYFQSVLTGDSHDIGIHSLKIKSNPSKNRLQNMIRKYHRSMKELPKPSISTYSKTHKLIIHRYLRIITVVLEVNSKPIQVIESYHLPTIISLLMKRSFSEPIQLPDPMTIDDNPIVKFMGVKRIYRIITFTTQFAAAVSKIYFSLSPEVIASSALQLHSGKNWTKSQIIAAAFSLSQLRYMFSLSFRCVQYLIKNYHHQFEVSEKKSLYISDENACIDLLMQSTHQTAVVHLLYPCLYPIDLNYQVSEKPIYLERSAIVATGACKLLLDGCDKVILHQATLFPSTVIDFENNELIPNNIDGIHEILRNNSHKTVGKEALNEELLSNFSGRKYLLSEITRKILIQPLVPQIESSFAGRSTASIMMQHLFENESCGSILTYNDYENFIRNVVEYEWK